MAEEQGLPLEKASRDDMMGKLSALMEKELARRGEEFTLQKQKMDAREIAAHNGLLPVLVWAASAKKEQASKKRFAMHYENDPTALLNVVPMSANHADGTQDSFAEWSHYAHYALEEFVRSFPKDKRQDGAIPLDDFYAQWYQAMQRGEYAIRPSTRPDLRQGSGAMGGQQKGA